MSENWHSNDLRGQASWSIIREGGKSTEGCIRAEGYKRIEGS